MKKTSRRNFGKLIAGAAAALPVASLSSISTEAQQHQDTPPDILLEEGSLKLDVKDVNLGAGDELPKHPSGNYYRWEFPTTATEIYIVGVQIVSGAGKILFFLNRDNVDQAEKLPLHILVHMEGTAGSRKELILSTEGKYVTFKVPMDRVLKKKRLTPNGPFEPGSTGRIRFRYFDTGGAENWKIEGVAVGIGPAGAHKVITRFNRANLGTAINGVQVMLWFDNLANEQRR